MKILNLAEIFREHSFDHTQCLDLLCSIHVVKRFGTLETLQAVHIKAAIISKHFNTIYPAAHFSKLRVITGPVKLFCFPFQMEVSKVLKLIQ